MGNTALVFKELYNFANNDIVLELHEKWFPGGDIHVHVHVYI